MRAAPLEVRLAPATMADAGELLTLQRACWVQEARENDHLELAPLHESLDEVREWMAGWTVLVAVTGGRLVGAVRGRLSYSGAWDIGRLMVAPDLQGHGLGRRLLEVAEGAAPDEARVLRLFTGAQSMRNQAIYGKAGYRLLGPLPDDPTVVRLEKPLR